jgi:hypothetical protein
MRVPIKIKITFYFACIILYEHGRQFRVRDLGLDRLLKVWVWADRVLEFMVNFGFGLFGF